jgi:ribosomal protein S12 methylthiotransferase accessory factor
LYADDIYKDPRTLLKRWTPETPTYWVEGQSLHTGRRRFVPAVLTYTPYRLDDPRRAPVFAIGVSTGQACHTDRIQALLSGLCEAIERDAFMITWMRRIPPTRVRYTEDAYLQSFHKRYFECPSHTFHIFDISLDIHVSTMLCVATGMSARGPFLNVGCSTHPIEREAILKALKEASQGAAWARELLAYRADWRPKPDFSNIITFEDHVRLYCEPEFRHAADFLFNTPRSRAVGEESSRGWKPEDGVRQCLDELDRQGLDAIVVDLTTPEIADLGYYVPKVLVPGLAQLTAPHVVPALGTPRLYEVHKKLGYTDPIHDLLNPTPHPFP